MSTTAWLPEKRSYLTTLAATVLTNRWIPERIKAGLNEKQSLFLAYDGPEALYGGAAGGGKSIALLMGALQYVDYKGYHALILRRNFTQLDQPGALHQRVDGVAGQHRRHVAGEKHRWLFPSGATLTFGHMAVENDKYNYQSSEYHYVAYDELTQFMEPMYLYLFCASGATKGASCPTGSGPPATRVGWVTSGSRSGSSRTPSCRHRRRSSSAASGEPPRAASSSRPSWRTTRPSTSWITRRSSLK